MAHLARHARLTLIGGVTGVVVSFVALFLSASCCSDSIVPSKSPLSWILQCICLPGGMVARQVDRSGGWPSLFAFCSVSFALWGAVTGAVSFLAGWFSHTRSTGPT